MGILAGSLAALVAAFLVFGLTYAIFVAVMRGKSAWKRLHWVGKLLLAPWALLGYIVGDIILVNWLIGSVLFVQLPTTITFTSRLQRNERHVGNGWLVRYRRVIADWICAELLDPFDPGHC